MKNQTISVLVAFLGWLGAIAPARSQGTAFTYQGRLNDGAVPAMGVYDLRFTIYDSTNSPGVVIAGPLTNSATGITNGLFTVSLDFGAGVFTGPARWLDIGVRTNGATIFTSLAPRQPLTPAPYAIFAAGVNAAGLSGTISPASLAGIYTNAVNFSNANNQFAGNGNGLTNIPLAALSSGEAIAQSGGFIPAPGLPTGSRPEFVAAADLNGDGKPDLVSVNDVGDSLTIYTNAGNNSFGLASSPAVGVVPTAVVAADVNGDGRMDLCCANEGDNTISVLTNKGAGQFLLASLPTASSPSSVSAADFNGDGRPDLVSSAFGFGFGNSLTILTNNGSGGFVLSASPVIGGGPYYVITADVNLDGRPDLVSTVTSNNTLVILTNNGSGGFATATTIALTTTANDVAAKDFNGDGKVDLVTANTLSNSLTVLTNNGSGGFATVSTPDVGPSPYFVATADVNGDGRPDLISANNADGTLTVLINSGGSAFVVLATIWVGPAPWCVVAADLNQDGRPDLVTATAGNNRLSVLYNSVAFTGGFTGSFNGTYAGDGRNLSNLDASALSLGTVPDARLSTNVDMLTLTQTFRALKTFGSSLRIGANGSSLSLVQTGTAAVGSGTNGVNTFTITFPVAFPVPPRVFIIARGNDNPDTFAVSTRAVTATDFKVNVMRLDFSGGWGQNLQLDWMACQ